MKKVKNKIVEAVKYKKQHPEESDRQISKKFNIDPEGLANKDFIFTDFNLKKEDFTYFFTDKDLKILEEHKNGISLEKLTNKTGVAGTTISNWEKILDCKVNLLRKYHFDEKKFDIIDNEEKAYWLGFLLADGYNNEDRGFLNIKLGIVDENHLKKFIDFMNSDVKITDDHGGSGQIVKSIYFNSRYLSDSLKKQGIFQGKSGKEKPNLNIPKELERHYIRGLIDGDGCLTHGINKYQLDLVGSLEIVTYLKEFVYNLCNLKMDNEHIYEHGTIFRFTIRDKEVLKRIYKELYCNCNVFLERKYKIAQQFLKV